jgi:hypothetical protein
MGTPEVRGDEAGWSLDYSYNAYGLNIRSNRPLPWLISVGEEVECETHPSIKCYFHESDTLLITSGRDRVIYESPHLNSAGEPLLRIYLSRSSDWYRFDYHDGTRFQVKSDASLLYASWVEPATIEDTAVYLVGPILGLVLRLCGLVTLHASGIVAEGKVVALVGSSGAGKSTLAAALTLSGYRVITEDLMALREQDGGIEVLPGYPAIRLWPEAVKSLYGDHDALPRMTPNWGKRYLDMAGTGSLFQRETLPLGAVYIIRERTTEPRSSTVGSVEGARALMALVGNTYSNYLLNAEMRSREFHFLGRLVTSIPVREITPREDVAAIFEVCDEVISDFKSICR